MITYKELEEAWEESRIELSPTIIQQSYECSTIVGIALSSIGIVSIIIVSFCI
jgi:hypothetical protein